MRHWGWWECRMCWIDRNLDPLMLDSCSWVDNRTRCSAGAAEWKGSSSIVSLLVQTLCYMLMLGRSDSSSRVNRFTAAAHQTLVVQFLYLYYLYNYFLSVTPLADCWCGHMTPPRWLLMWSVGWRYPVGLLDLRAAMFVWSRSLIFFFCIFKSVNLRAGNNVFIQQCPVNPDESAVNS